MYGYATCQTNCGQTDYARALAGWAKMELLKEKVKQRIDAKYGKKLDGIADLIVELVEEERQTSAALDEKQETLESQMDSLMYEEEE